MHTLYSCVGCRGVCLCSNSMSYNRGTPIRTSASHVSNSDQAAGTGPAVLVALQPKGQPSIGITLHSCLHLHMLAPRTGHNTKAEQRIGCFSYQPIAYIPTTPLPATGMRLSCHQLKLQGPKRNLTTLCMIHAYNKLSAYKAYGMLADITCHNAAPAVLHHSCSACIRLLHLCHQLPNQQFTFQNCIQQHLDTCPEAATP